MIRKPLFAALTIFGLCAGGFANSDSKSGAIAVVNFSTCMSDSKFGKQEQASFESIQNQLTSLLKDGQKQIQELEAKFNDPEYMDGLSPEAEEEMKIKYQQVSEEMSRYQNQYYQVLQQTNMKIMQSMGANIQEASEKVAKHKKLTMVVNKEACFFFTPTLDVTDAVITELDKAYELKNAKTANAPAVDAPNTQAKK